MLPPYPRPRFRLDLTAWALRRREQNEIDTWDGRSYRRALLIQGHPVAVAVTQAGTPGTPRLDVVITGRALPPAIYKTVAGAAVPTPFRTRGVAGAPRKNAGKPDTGEME